MPAPNDPLNRVRASGVAAVIVIVALGLGLQLLERSSLVDVLGSMLYVDMAGLLLLLAWPTLPALAVASVALAIAMVIELLQLTVIPGFIVDAFPPARLVLGSAFDPLDLAAYAAGAVVLLLLVQAIARSSRRSTATATK
ncbi:DUF2809 domain-containing protein [Agromyces sp. NPDC058484]|uniref:DUF2809 domain-containing protein n=1 Tax=Agromyces sp. NPDC058484 TaxID=3346524 RepID=UPI00365D57F4